MPQGGEKPKFTPAVEMFSASLDSLDVPPSAAESAPNMF